jgi:PKD repeat protein
MSLSFAGVRLALLPDDYRQWITDWHSLSDFRFSDLWHFEGYGLGHLPTPPMPKEDVPEVGVLYWPTGLCRCGFVHYLIDLEGLEDIRTALGTGSGPEDLVLEDDLNGTSVTVPMYFLCARPLSQIVGDDRQLFLMTLVDRRYHLRQRTGSVTGVSTWGTLLSDLATALGITLTVDTVDADYDSPTSQWLFYEEYLSPVVDAACYRVGHRVVANLDGTFRTVSVTTASGLQNPQVLTLTKTAGGVLEREDLRRPVPASVKVIFRNSAAAAPHTVTKTLTGLAISEYDSAAGVTGEIYPIWGEIVYDGTNGTACDDYATQAATDFYLWALTDTDITYPSVTEWTPTGCEDRVEWKYLIDRILTRVVRWPFQVLYSGLSTYPSAGSSLTIGCNLSLTGSTVSVDVPSLIGDGLVLNGDDVCDKIDVAVGCGLQIDGDGAVAFDADAVAGNGLEVSGTCTLNADLGCGLEFDIDGAIAVNNDTLAGTAATTALVVSGTCGLAFDQTITDTTAVTYQTNTAVSANYCTGTLSITKTLQTITDRYNAAGVIVDRVYGSPATTTVATVDLCLMLECCEAAALEVVAAADPTSGAAPLLVNFTATPSGGVAPYTYSWDFDDGGSSALQNPSHTYTTCGEFEATVTVTDACGCQATDSVIITVTCSDCGIECPGTSVAGGGPHYATLVAATECWFNFGVLNTESTYSVTVTTDANVTVDITQQCSDITTQALTPGTTCFEFLTGEIFTDQYAIGFLSAAGANVNFTIAEASCP